MAKHFTRRAKQTPPRGRGSVMRPTALLSWLARRWWLLGLVRRGLVGLALSAAALSALALASLSALPSLASLSAVALASLSALALALASLSAAALSALAFALRRCRRQAGWSWSVMPRAVALALSRLCRGLVRLALALSASACAALSSLVGLASVVVAAAAGAAALASAFIGAGAAAARLPACGRCRLGRCCCWRHGGAAVLAGAAGCLGVGLIGATGVVAPLTEIWSLILPKVPSLIPVTFMTSSGLLNGPLALR